MLLHRSKVEFDNLSEKLKDEINSKERANDILKDLVMKQKNLVVFGIQEDQDCTNKRSQNEVDLKLLNQVILQNCPVKCSFTVRLGRLNNGKCRPIKLFFRSPIERDAASFFFLSFSQDCTKLELAQKKRNNALKEELNQKVTAGESGWKIKDGKGGLELVKISSFQGENSLQIPREAVMEQ